MSNEEATKLSEQNYFLKSYHKCHTESYITSLPITQTLHAARLCVSALPGADTYNCVIQLYACYYDCTHTWWRCERIVYTPSPGSRLYRYWHISTNTLISSTFRLKHIGTHSLNNSNFNPSIQVDFTKEVTYPVDYKAGDNPNINHLVSPTPNTNASRITITHFLFKSDVTSPPIFRSHLSRNSPRSSLEQSLRNQTEYLLSPPSSHMLLSLYLYTSLSLYP